MVLQGAGWVEGARGENWDNCNKIKKNKKQKTQSLPWPGGSVSWTLSHEPRGCTYLGCGFSPSQGEYKSQLINQYFSITLISLSLSLPPSLPLLLFTSQGTHNPVDASSNCYTIEWMLWCDVQL